MKKTKVLKILVGQDYERMICGPADVSSIVATNVSSVDHAELLLRARRGAAQAEMAFQIAPNKNTIFPKDVLFFLEMGDALEAKTSGAGVSLICSYVTDDPNSDCAPGSSSSSSSAVSSSSSSEVSSSSGSSSSDAPVFNLNAQLIMKNQASSKIPVSLWWQTPPGQSGASYQIEVSLDGSSWTVLTSSSSSSGIGIMGV